jgi:hypothetical protein
MHGTNIKAVILYFNTMTLMHNIRASLHSQFDFTILREPLNKFIINPLYKFVFSFFVLQAANSRLRCFTVEVSKSHTPSSVALLWTNDQLL